MLDSAEKVNRMGQGDLARSLDWCLMQTLAALLEQLQEGIWRLSQAGWRKGKQQGSYC